MTPIFAEIPHWTARGVLPPMDPENPTGNARSPYRVELRWLILDFAVSPERWRILEGLLKYRQRLHQAGLVEGFQWLDGSFFEHIEQLEGRPPNDIDVVTFHAMPEGQTQQTLWEADPGLFPRSGAEKVQLKQQYKVDAYTQSLAAHPEFLVSRSAYWYSLWAHRRDETWKGFVEIDLSPAGEAEAHEALRTTFTGAGLSATEMMPQGQPS